MSDWLQILENPAVILFLVCYAFICISGRFRATVLWLGVLLLIGIGSYRPAGSPVNPLHDALDVLRHINWNVLMILAGAMMVAELFILSRVPVLLADVIVRRLKTVGGAALGVCALASLLSAFIDNVTTVLIVAPVAIALARRLKTSPVPFVIGLAICSNLQGAATMIGDPPSLILANGLKLNFLDFFFYRGRPGIFWAMQVGAVGSMTVLWSLFFRKYKAPAAKPELSPVTSWLPAGLLVGMILALSLVSQLAEPLGRHVPRLAPFANGLVCIGAGLTGMVWYLRNGVRSMLAVIVRLDLRTVALLGGVFALTYALLVTGVIDQVADRIERSVGGSEFLAYAVIVWVSVLLSALVDNIPYTAVMLPTVLKIATRMQGSAEGAITQTHVLFALGLLTGACLGGNISPVGASANIVGIGILRREGHRTGFWEFVRMGLPFTLAATVPAFFFLWWAWG